MLHSRTKTVRGYGKRKNNVVNVHQDFSTALASPAISRVNHRSTKSTTVDDDSEPEHERDDATAKKAPEVAESERTSDPVPPARQKRKAFAELGTRPTGNITGRRANSSAILDIFASESKGSTVRKLKPKLASSNVPSIPSTPSRPVKSTFISKPPKPADVAPAKSNLHQTTAALNVRTHRAVRPAIAALSLSNAPANPGIRMATTPNSAASVSSSGSYHTAMSEQAAVGVALDLEEEGVIRVRPTNFRDRTRPTGGVKGKEEARVEHGTIRVGRPVRARTSAPIIDLSSSSSGEDLDDATGSDGDDYTPTTLAIGVGLGGERVDEDEDEDDEPVPRRRKGKGQQRTVVRAGTVVGSRVGPKSKVVNSPNFSVEDESMPDKLEQHDRAGPAERVSGSAQGSVQAKNLISANSPKTLDNLLALCDLRSPQPFNDFIAAHPFFPTGNRPRSKTVRPKISGGTSLVAALSVLSVSEDNTVTATKSVATETGKKPKTAKLSDTTSANCYTKIGEASFSEVFGVWDRSGTSGRAECGLVMKVIPLRRTPRAMSRELEAQQEVGTEASDKVELSEITDVIREIEVTKLMSEMHEGFITFLGAYVVQGGYPNALLDAWEAFDEERGSDSVRPSNLPVDQLYAIVLLSNGGLDLEHFNFSKAVGWQQALSVVTQLAEALAVAEAEGRFEHRDLHEGQVLLRSHGSSVSVTIIDFGLSRLDHPESDAVYFSAIPEDVFEGVGEQWDVYRAMRKMVGARAGAWSEYHPFSNVLWLQYLVRTMLHSTPSLRKPATQATANALARRDPSRSPIGRQANNGRDRKGAAVANGRCYEVMLRLDEMLTGSVKAMTSARAPKRPGSKKSTPTAGSEMETILAWLAEAF